MFRGFVFDRYCELGENLSQKGSGACSFFEIRRRVFAPFIEIPPNGRFGPRVFFLSLSMLRGLVVRARPHLRRQSTLAVEVAEAVPYAVRPPHTPDPWQPPLLDERDNDVDTSVAAHGKHWEVWDEAAIREASHEHCVASWTPTKALDDIPTLVHAEGIYLHAADGRRFIECAPGPCPGPPPGNRAALPVVHRVAGMLTLLPPAPAQPLTAGHHRRSASTSGTRLRQQWSRR